MGAKNSYWLVGLKLCWPFSTPSRIHQHRNPCALGVHQTTLYSSLQQLTPANLGHSCQSHLLSVPLWHVLKGREVSPPPGKTVQSSRRGELCHHHLPHCSGNSEPITTLSVFWTVSPSTHRDRSGPGFQKEVGRQFLIVLSKGVQLSALYAPFSSLACTSPPSSRLAGQSTDKYLTPLKTQSVLDKGVSKKLMQPWTLQIFYSWITSSLTILSSLWLKTVSWFS